MLESGAIGATRIADGAGRFDANAEAGDVAACDLELWKLDGSERELELERDDSHANDSAPA